MNLFGASSFAGDLCIEAALPEDDLPSVIVAGFSEYEMALDQYKREMQLRVKQGVLTAKEAKSHIDEYAKALEESRARKKS